MRSYTRPNRPPGCRFTFGAATPHWSSSPTHTPQWYDILARSWENGAVRLSAQDGLSHFRRRSLRIAPLPRSLVLCRLVKKTFSKSYSRPGDWIEVDGHYGEVVHTGMRTVALVTADDDYITVPHLKLWSSAVRNANNGSPTLQCTASVHVHPEHDAARARATLEDVAMTSPYRNFDEPVVVAIREETWGTKYTIRAYPVDPRQQFRFVTDLTVRGREALARIGARALLPPAAAFSPASQPTL